MLPQFLIQNRILSQDENRDFQLDWEKAADVLNLNFFHYVRLIDESTKYQKLLRPWEEVFHQVPSNLKVHQYYMSTAADVNNHIYAGSMVGRVRSTTTGESVVQQDCLILTSSITKYIYNPATHKFIASSDVAIPNIIRPALWGLEQIHQVALNQCNLDHNIYTYQCDNADFGFIIDNNFEPYLQFNQDIILGRIYYNNEIIANVPVTIKRKWNSIITQYEYRLSFANLDFPATAYVEFY